MAIKAGSDDKRFCNPLPQMYNLSELYEDTPDWSCVPVEELLAVASPDTSTLAETFMSTDHIKTEEAGPAAVATPPTPVINVVVNSRTTKFVHKTTNAKLCNAVSPGRPTVSSPIAANTTSSAAAAAERQGNVFSPTKMAVATEAVPEEKGKMTFAPTTQCSIRVKKHTALCGSPSPKKNHLKKTNYKSNKERNNDSVLSLYGMQDTTTDTKQPRKRRRSNRAKPGPRCSRRRSSNSAASSDENNQNVLNGHDSDEDVVILSSSRAAPSSITTSSSSTMPKKTPVKGGDCLITNYFSSCEKPSYTPPSATVEGVSGRSKTQQRNRRSSSSATAVAATASVTPLTARRGLLPHSNGGMPVTRPAPLNTSPTLHSRSVRGALLDSLDDTDSDSDDVIPLTVPTITIEVPVAPHTPHHHH